MAGFIPGQRVYYKHADPPHTVYEVTVVSPAGVMNSYRIKNPTNIAAGEEAVYENDLELIPLFKVDDWVSLTGEEESAKYPGKYRIESFTTSAGSNTNDPVFYRIVTDDGVFAQFPYDLKPAPLEVGDWVRIGASKNGAPESCNNTIGPITDIDHKQLLPYEVTFTKDWNWGYVADELFWIPPQIEVIHKPLTKAEIIATGHSWISLQLMK